MNHLLAQMAAEAYMKLKTQEAMLQRDTKMNHAIMTPFLLLKLGRNPEPNKGTSASLGFPGPRHSQSLHPIKIARRLSRGMCRDAGENARAQRYF